MRLRISRPGPDPSISARRSARLFRLLMTLANAPGSRAQLIRLGRAGMRTFYRDLNFLNECGIEVRILRGRHALVTPLRAALGRLPFPAPDLSFQDVMELTKGRGGAQAKLRAQFRRLTA